jgi:uncharacterized membrane protein YqiK
MSDDDQRTTARGLKHRQDEKAELEAREAERAADPDTAHAHRRRADKAAYLRDKLAEAERSG